MNDTLYKQCTLRNKKTDAKHVAWIEADIAFEGTTVSFKDEPINDFFIVDEIRSHITKPWSELNERGQDYKRTRSASDI